MNQSFTDDHSILNQLPMGVVVVNGQGDILRINPYFTQLTGYEASEIPTVDEWFLKAYPDPDYRKSVMETWGNDHSQKSAQRVFDVTCKDGSIKTISFTAQFLPDQNAMVTLTDVSDQAVALKTLEKSEKTIKSIFMAAPTGIGVVSDRVFVSANERLCEMTGYTEEELIGQPSIMLYPTREEYDFVGDEKYRQISQKGTGTVETRWRHKDGRIMYVLLSSTPINPEDLSEGVTFTALDITDQKTLENALKESEARYREYFDEILSGAFISKPDGLLLDCNQEYLNIFGFETKEEALTVSLRDLYQSPRARKRFLDKLISEKRVKRFQARMKKQDGTPIHTTENAVGVFNENGDLIFIRGYLSDITETKRMESQLRQAQKMEAIGTLVGGISHDFNNLIQAIGGYIELLQMDKDENHPDFTQIDALRQVTKRAGDLVQQLLVFSREAETKKKVIAVNDEIRQVKNLLEQTIPKMIDIKLKLADTLWTVFADPLQIEQVLLNLGVNAADAMPGGGKIIIESQNIELTDDGLAQSLGLAQGNYVLLSVTDNGHGMHKTVLDRIFDPFFTTKEIGKGTGLGLSSVYGIVKSHDGAITCQSQVGEGTCFYIYLPASEKAPDEQEQEENGKLQEGGETILLVDDETSILEITSQAFRKMGYTFVEAESGEQALEIYTDHGEKIDLIILDLSMPGMGGYKCLEKLLSLDPDVRVLVASGYSAEATINDCLALGAVGYIQKPYRLGNLFSQVRTLLDEEIRRH